ncbi:MAG: photosystem II reaction center protein M [Cyanobacteria bacterium QS_8_64_29]|nr:MAG: photosystem II reaction center protein M [Cyanobacteria bacterium QS_8_64_29]
MDVNTWGFVASLLFVLVPLVVLLVLYIQTASRNQQSE